MNQFMRAPINMPCPVCGSALRATLDDVKMERTVRCPRGHEIRLLDKDNGTQKLDRELRKLDQTIRQSGIKVKYRRR